MFHVFAKRKQRELILSFEETESKLLESFMLETLCLIKAEK